MKKTDTASDSAALRQKAEELSNKNPLQKGLNLSEADALKLVHELEVHQIELEMQNEELVLAKEQAEAAAEKYTELFDFAPLGYFILSQEGTIKESNHLGSQMLGKERSYAVKKLFSVFVSDDTKPVFDLFLKKIFITSKKELCDVVLSGTGRDRMLVHLTGIVHENGARCFITAVDITESRQTEVGLRNSQEKNRLSDIDLKEAQAVSHIGSWKWDVKQNAVSWSDEMYRIFGIDSLSYAGPLEDVIAKVVHPDDLHIVLPANAPSFAEKKPMEYRIILPDKSIRFIWAKTGNAVYDAEGNLSVLMGIAQDVTERKTSEEALRQAQKLESIGTLAGGIAHDFNNLMNAVLGQSALALRKLPQESPAAGHIAKAIRASERVADLTKQLLAYSGRGKLIIKEFDLNSLVEENVQLFEVGIPKTTQLRYDLGSPSPHIMGDVGQIQQVIMNLIINAGEAMDTRPGFITVRTGRIDIRQAAYQYSKFTGTMLDAGSYALLQVRDTGCGIKVESLTHIFDPFFTTKFAGRGLGLAAVLGIIKGHAGGLNIESEPGKGTMFEIVVPLAPDSSVIVVPERKPSSALKGDGKTILIIDDEPTIIELLEDVFSQVNFKVLSASNPLKGIEIYGREFQNISLVVLDYSMPHMNGKAAFEELLKINKEVQVLLCSGYSEDETMSAFEKDRPTAFFHKPYDAVALEECVSEILSKKERS